MARPVACSETREYSEGMKTLVMGLAIILAPLLAGCTMTPEQRAATEKAWAERDRERAAECAAQGLSYVGGSCVFREGRPG